MSAPEGLDGYRTLFADPTKPLDLASAEATSYLMQQLLGQPPISASDTPPGALGEFVASLGRRMQGARTFDHKSMAQLHPAGFLPALYAQLASAIRNNNTIVGEVSPVETVMEKEAVDWMLANIAGFNPIEGSGSIVTDGTMANLTALMVARESLTEAGWDGKRKAVILATELAHYSIQKAAAVLAPAGTIEIVTVPMQEGTFKMDCDALESIVQRHQEAGDPIMAIVGVAGETETGLVDDIERIADVAESHNVYLHVDAAYGGPFALSSQAALFSGLHRANSVTVDPHKYMFAPYNAGAILFRNAHDHELLYEANQTGGRYVLKDNGEIVAGVDESRRSFREKTDGKLGLRRIEGSMGGQGAAATWASIQTLGREGLGVLLDHALDMAQVAYDEVLSSPYFAPAFNPELNSLCFYPDPGSSHNFGIRPLLEQSAVGEDGKITFPKQRRLVMKAQQILERRTGIYLATTTLPIPSLDRRGERQYMEVFRLVTTHPYTEAQNVRDAIAELTKIWKEIIDEEMEGDTVTLQIANPAANVISGTAL